MSNRAEIFTKAIKLQELACGQELSFWLSLLKGQDRSFLLESGLDVAGMGEWSFLGAHPIASFQAKGDKWQADEICDKKEGPNSQRVDGKEKAWAALEEWWASWGDVEQSWPGEAECRPPFLGGAVGYLSYEFGEELEQIEARVLEPAQALSAHFELYDEFLAYQHSTKRCFLITRGRSHQEGRSWWADAFREEDQVEAWPTSFDRSGDHQSSLSISDEEYLKGVEQIRSRIGRGEVYELNYCRQHSFPAKIPFWQLHKRMSELQPVPYGAAFNWDPVAILCASPERFLRRKGSYVDTRPIKGTAPRVHDEEADRVSSSDLLASPKERAELAMIIDLERNDLGRVCLPGSVKVIEDYALEAYSTVFHTVATVSGELPQGRNPWPLIKACFPGGSITGAPKIAAMKATRELEPVSRGVYTGSIGWIGADGDLDLNIAIRTVWRCQGRDHISLGGAITWDSIPEAELAELSAKGKALFEALRL